MRSALAVCLLCASPAAAQLFPANDALIAVPEIVVRPADEDLIPRGGLFVATLSYGEERITSASFSPEGDTERLQELTLFERCVRGTKDCIWQSRFPLEQPEGEEVAIEVQQSAGDVGQVYFALPVEADLSPPEGLQTAALAVNEEAPTLARPEPVVFVEMRAPDLDPAAVGLLALYEVTEGDKDLLGHVIVRPWWSANDMTVVAPVDVPESANRCFSLEATSLGGVTAATEARCVDIIVDPGCAHLRAPGDAPARAGILALLLLALAFARLRQRA